jgi:hypothetical protein
LQCAGGRGRTYHRDNVLLDGDREGNELEVEGEVELLGVGEVSYYRIGLVRTGRQRTELRRRAREMVCCACVIVRDCECYLSVNCDSGEKRKGFVFSNVPRPKLRGNAYGTVCAG